MSDAQPRLEGERGVSDVASTRAPWITPRRKALAISAGTVLLIGFIIWKNPGQKKEDPGPPPPENGIGQVVQYTPPKPDPLPAPAPPPLPQSAPPAQSAPPSPPPAPAEPPAPRPFTERVNIAPTKPKPKMLSYGASEPTGTSESHGGRGAGASGPSGSRTHVAFKGAEIAGAEAGPAIDKTLVLMPGLIRCILDVAVDSSLPGPLVCHLPDPVISDGNVTLMEKGSQIFGSYTSDVKQGQYRLMSVSATGWTPNGIPVPLGGPLADSLGRTGLPGNVDNHTLERFGGAALLTFAEGALGIAQSSVSKGGNSYVSLNTGNGVGGLAEEVLRNTINIPPTITKSQGDEVFIWILQPVDFRAAYKLTNK